MPPKLLIREILNRTYRSYESYKSYSGSPGSPLIVEELANVRVARRAHLLIATAEYDVSIPQHDEFGVDQAQPVAFVLEDQVAVIVAHDVFAGQHLDVLQTVRDEDRGYLFQVAQFQGQLADRACGDRVEAGGRLIVEDDLRTSDQGPRDAHAPAHAPRKLVRHLVHRLLQIDEPQHAHDDRLDLGLARLLLAQAVGDVVVNREAVEQRALLKDHPDLLPYLHQPLFGVIGDVFTVYENAPRIGFDQPQGQAQQRGLPRAAPPHHDLGFAVAHIEADFVQNRALVERE